MLLFFIAVELVFNYLFRFPLGYFNLVIDQRLIWNEHVYLLAFDLDLLELKFLVESLRETEILILHPDAFCFVAIQCLLLLDSVDCLQSKEYIELSTFAERALYRNTASHLLNNVLTDA